MYRISFDTRTSRFIVQVLRFGLFWATCRSKLADDDLQFETYVEARKWVTSIGLNRAYPEQPSKADYEHSAHLPRVDWRACAVYD